MRDKTLVEKLKKILSYVEDESNKPIENYNYETRIWSKGYRKAMITLKNYIWDILNKDN